MNTKKFLKKMTIEDKAKLLCGTTPNSLGGFESKAGFVPKINMQDGGTGMNFNHLFSHSIIDEEFMRRVGPEAGYKVMFNFYNTDIFTEEEKAVRSELNERLIAHRDGIDAGAGCYPPGILLASTWNPKAVFNTGKALGLEAAIYRVGVLLGTPNCNILREPRNGRFFEGYSEDPFLAKSLAPEMCKGVESMGVSSNVKHFVCNNQEINRQTINELVSIRALREVYFPAFEACSKVASTLMTSYPSVNGRFCTENPWLLNDVLRKEWGFKGITVTDWDAKVHNMGKAVEAGQDLFMPGPRDPKEIIDAVKDGTLKEKDLDAAALRMLELIDKFAAVRKPEGMTSAKYKKFGDKAAYEAAAEGIVMLKNKTHLPLKKNAKVVFFGPEAFADYGEGSAKVTTDRTTILSEELAKTLGAGNVLKDDLEAFRKGATAIVIEKIISGEGADRPDLKLNKKTVSVIKKLAANRGKGKICLILNVPGPVELEGIEELADSIFAVFYPGMMGAKAMADILTGKVNPSGALPCTFPVAYKDTPAYLCYPDSLTCNYGEGIFVGYKGYQKRGIKPLFAFGEGLSYSKFKVSYIVSSDKGNKINVTIGIANQSKMDGKKVVQVYASKRNNPEGREICRLVGFAKPMIKAGCEKEVTISIDKSELKYFDEMYDKFLFDGGNYDLFVSLNGVNELIPAGNIYIESSDEIKCGAGWSLKKISEVKALTDALSKDCEALGLPFVMFMVNLEYVPSMKLSELFKETDKLENFNKAAGEYRPE